MATPVGNAIMVAPTIPQPGPKKYSTERVIRCAYVMARSISADEEDVGDGSALGFRTVVGSDKQWYTNAPVAQYMTERYPVDRSGNVIGIGPSTSGFRTENGFTKDH